MALDVAALCVAFLVAWYLRGGLGEFLASAGQLLGYNLKPLVRTSQDASENIRILLSPNPLVNIQKHLWLGYLSVPAWIFFLHTQRGYDPQARRNGRQEFALCAYSGMLGTVAIMVFMVLFKLDVSRLLLVGYLSLGVLMLWLERRVLLPLAQRGAKTRRNILLIGPLASARRFSQVLATPAYSRAQLLGYIDENSKDREEGLRHLGTLQDLPRILDADVVDEVVLIRSASDAGALSDVGTEYEGRVSWGDILELCLERGRTVSLVDDLAPPLNAKVEAQMFGTMPTLVLHNTPQNTFALVIKEIADRVLALAALIVLAPVFAIVALLIKLHDKGPIFFAQERVGLNGRTFKFYKFRSMHVNAQDILETMKREDRARYDAINTMQDPFFKAKDGDDPRITPIGRFIRKTSLDELPQFYNVLRGDMSLVGPRPPLPKEVAELEPWHRRKLSVKGGLTCIWQASGRNNVNEVDEWMRMDLEYIDNWSLWLDVKLLFKTVKAMVTTKGAS
jgi:exopolysaccharide biosynthesis polyprenyl glycosylphosphotransferase